MLNKLLPVPAADEVGGRLEPPPKVEAKVLNKLLPADEVGGRLEPPPKVEAKVCGIEDAGDSPVIALTRVSKPGISSVFSDIASHL